MASSRPFKLAKESDLRIEVGTDAPLRVRLLSGTAEIFGTEMPGGNWLSIPSTQQDRSETPFSLCLPHL
ncbi:Pre-mRNA cleavage complex II protein Clp1 [Musa troglodytarum]|uniref:Pre-mRNA cleavage complex II protein Clp1 n=1 Tax=Musa troglodytarum TaxID=320322 RepID=A0A9E7G9E0_9LILI|nr:Pre-mRNA cleavage complex II protein Clp1 [Musa troglodytarum]